MVKDKLSIEARIKRLENAVKSSKVEKHCKNKKFEANTSNPISKDEWDFDNMIQEVGDEYISEELPYSELFEMESFNDILNDPFEAVEKAFHGKDQFGSTFNPDRKWFTFDAYANLLSVDDKDIYYADVINEEDLLQWCIDAGYVE